MTPKQKINSIKKKMQRIEKVNTEIYFQKIRSKFYEIKRWNALSQKLFHAEFELYHCQNCGKKL